MKITKKLGSVQKIGSVETGLKLHFKIFIILSSLLLLYVAVSMYSILLTATQI